MTGQTLLLLVVLLVVLALLLRQSGVLSWGGRAGDTPLEQAWEDYSRQVSPGTKPAQFEGQLRRLRDVLGQLYANLDWLANTKDGVSYEINRPVWDPKVRDENDPTIAKYEFPAWVASDPEFRKQFDTMGSRMYDAYETISEILGLSKNEGDIVRYVEVLRKKSTGPHSTGTHQKTIVKETLNDLKRLREAITPIGSQLGVVAALLKNTKSAVSKKLVNQLNPDKVGSLIDAHVAKIRELQSQSI